MSFLLFLCAPTFYMAFFIKLFTVIRSFFNVVSIITVECPLFIMVGTSVTQVIKVCFFHEILFLLK